MGLYVYTNEDESEYVEVFQKMNDDHIYIHTDGKKWRRVFTIPQASIDTKLDVWSPKDFTRKTANKKGTIGDLFDESAAASEKRKGSGQVDEIKEQYYVDYSKKRSGAVHDDVKKREIKKKLDQVGISITPN